MTPKAGGPWAPSVTLAGFSLVKRKKINSWFFDTASGCCFFLGPFSRSPHTTLLDNGPTAPGPRWLPPGIAAVAATVEELLREDQGDGERGVMSERPDVPQARRGKPGECQTPFLPNALGTNVYLLFMHRRTQEVWVAFRGRSAFASSFLQLCLFPVDESCFMCLKLIIAVSHRLGRVQHVRCHAVHLNPLKIMGYKNSSPALSRLYFYTKS